MLPIRLALGDVFFDEEYRDGYLVTSDIKKLWAVELDLLAKFDEVCKKYNIKYFLAYGTLLGAVRHRGFIPWDDDIDIVIFRDDYEKLLSISEKEFKDVYLLQSAYTDKNYMRGHLQLRNTKTCMMLPHEAKVVEFNQGVFLDIFILDGLVNDMQLLQEQFHEMQNIKRKMRYIAYRNKGSSFRKVWRTVRAKLVSFIFGSVKEQYCAFEEIAKRYSDSEDVEILMFRNSAEDCIRQKRKWYSEVCLMEFEGMKLPVPKDYHQILTLCYGKDYIIPKQVSSSHGAVIISTKHSFKKILEEL
ncbi:MAG: LicD family protein [Phascolarctobacterium sp.]|nr:LicD family protein [Phascolarctobacterium sp.]